jgi:hypothetical protein
MELSSRGETAVVMFRVVPERARQVRRAPPIAVTPGTRSLGGDAVVAVAAGVTVAEVAEAQAMGGVRVRAVVGAVAPSMA